ncbi:MAG: KamA family radical SAM protein [Deltaproteobacteria bacterium]|nr:KamA family radical SAM protein [Deltaproteobacteria bacterium]
MNNRNLLAHREFLEGPFWQKIPAYRDVRESDFLDYRWQAKNSVTNSEKLFATLKGVVSEAFIADVRDGLLRSTMSIRVSPYILSLINWDAPYDDPLRIQFVPVKSRMRPDHPKLGLDSLNEQADAPVPGLTHRYPDKALFLPLNTCPVYCRFCTRSYAVGIDTEEVEKVPLGLDEERWQKAFDYIARTPALEDIVISGGDAFNLRARDLERIGMTLLGMENIRRMRFATKGPAVMPQKILSDTEWVDALTRVVDAGRKIHKDVVVHTHFNHPNEITAISRAAMDRLFERGIVVRNQSVLQRGVNDSVDTMQLLIKKLAFMNVHPYYVYVHDLVRGVEDLRTTVSAAVRLEKHVRGTTGGFNTPIFAVDAPGGGGKRDVHSYEFYDRATGISVYSSPTVRPGRHFIYFDPIHLLGDEGQKRWASPDEQRIMIADALNAAAR